MRICFACKDLQKGDTMCQSPPLVFSKSFCWEVSPYLLFQRNYFLLYVSHTGCYSKMCRASATHLLLSLAFDCSYLKSFDTMLNLLSLTKTFRRKFGETQTQDVYRQLKGSVSMYSFLWSFRFDLAFWKDQLFLWLCKWTSFFFRSYTVKCLGWRGMSLTYPHMVAVAVLTVGEFGWREFLVLYP